MAKRVRCASGVIGEQSKLQSRYDNYEEFKQWSDTYGLAKRLGFSSNKAAWQANPTIQSSTVPEDFRSVPEKK